MTKETNNKNFEIKNRSEKSSEVELEISISVDFVESFRTQAIKNLGQEIEIKGFRKGAAPETMIVEKIGEHAIYEEQAFIAVNKILPEIIESEKLDIIAQPKISILKIAKNNTLEIKAGFILMPTVKLPDYKKIAKEVALDTDTKASQKEIDDYIDYVRKMKAESDLLKKKTSNNLDERKEFKDAELVLPELNDEFIKTLGEFKDVTDFKTQLTENISKEKEKKAEQKRRIEIIEKIIKESEVNLPEILIEEELERMLAQFKGDIQRMKMEPQDYLKEIKKTEEDLKKEWRVDAEKRAKMNMILPRIAIQENLKTDTEKIEHEVKHLKEHHPEINEQDAKIYYTQVLLNEEVFKFLENQK
jgi:FKBP-type peptidyl-prolyl cis-trans isomerase (trigger factor)